MFTALMLICEINTTSCFSVSNDTLYPTKDSCEFAIESIEAEVAVRDESDVSFGLVRMYELMSGNASYRVPDFRKLEEGLAWLEESEE